MICNLSAIYVDSIVSSLSDIRYATETLPMFVDWMNDYRKQTTIW